MHKRSSPDVKIALFRSLFRGRDDVYPQRFESRTSGKSGYSPACANEWVRGICEKPRVKCATCRHRQFPALTDDVIRWHLSGRDDRGAEFVLGVYPMLLDETCFFLAMDFDKHHWLDDSLAVQETCERIGVPAYLEKSRSGNGGHVWIFFEHAVPATIARRLGSYLLTETTERRPEIGLDSYDRFFPSQDTLPRGGFGNLIALPLQKRARAFGNSVFLNKLGEPHPDQWSFLASVERMTRAATDELVSHAARRGRILNVRIAASDDENPEPWALSPSRREPKPTIRGPFPDRIVLTLGDQIYIAKEGLPATLRNQLIRLAAFQNPEFYKAQAMRLPTYDKPRIICCAEEYEQHLALPRGCFEDVETLLKDLKIETAVVDERVRSAELPFRFLGELREGQQLAVEKLLQHETGVLSATTAFGKTVVAARMIAERGRSTLILVHRRQLLDQWVDRLSQFLNVDEKEIGRIGGGRKNATGRIDVAVIQSLVRKGAVKDCVADYEHLIIDECHHVSARSFELVARRAKARFVLGLSATVTRKDGHHPVIFMQCGPIRHTVDAKAESVARPFRHTVLVCPTSFQSVLEASSDMRVQFQDLYTELMADDRRNAAICGEVVQSVKGGRSPIVLTERKEHLETLANRLRSQVDNVIVLKGGTGRKERQQIQERLAAINADEERVLVATGRYVGEGFDDDRLDTLFLTLPVSWKGTIAQYVGRLHRLRAGKTEVRVYDFADLNVPMLARMFDRRCKGYEDVGYTVMLPGSAVPGWPPNVPLPVDPQWKSDYSASVQRLIRDGVDEPLAALFVHAAKPVTVEASGVDFARSASEAFLFGRLQTLDATRDQFRLNQNLPIAFNGWGNMEVDFLHVRHRLVIELDGGQHFANEDAYRRDRRKDAMLQENGYFVLRFLAQDVGAKLNDVLDAHSTNDLAPGIKNRLDVTAYSSNERGVISGFVRFDCGPVLFDSVDPIWWRVDNSVFERCLDVFLEWSAGR
ncbi:MAG: DEAD/DEAH box helicase family protein [Fuerstiella sp.]